MVTFYGGPMNGHEYSGLAQKNRARHLIVPQLFFSHVFAPRVFVRLLYEWCDTDDSLFYVGWQPPSFTDVKVVSGKIETTPWSPEVVEYVMTQIRAKYGAELEELPA